MDKKINILTMDDLKHRIKAHSNILTFLILFTILLYSLSKADTDKWTAKIRAEKLRSIMKETREQLLNNYSEEVYHGKEKT